jgi:SAM-dependent methyltransferase
MSSSSKKRRRETGALPPHLQAPVDLANENILGLASADEVSRIYDRLEGSDAYTVARDHRARLRSEGKISESEALQYGEIDCAAFSRLLMGLELNVAGGENTSFVDVGSGSGKAVLVAASTGKFNKATGIEIVEDLHKMAIKAKEGWTGGRNTEVHFIRDDCFNCEWQETDHTSVLYLPITCFTPEMVSHVCERVKSTIRKGSIILCTSTLTPLDDDSLCGAVLRRLSVARIRYGKGTMAFTTYEKV